MLPEPITRSTVALRGIGYKDNTDAAEIRSLRGGEIINRFLMESVAPARYLRIAGHTQHRQPMRPSLNLENQMALLWRTFWERSHAA
jgi:hypothetical protein